MKKYVYNLSYDISNKEANKCDLSAEERLERGKKFIEFLYNSKILLLNKSFSLVGNNGKKEQHDILKPVESTIIFASQLERKDICTILNSHEDLSYVLTDIPQTGTKNIGTLKCVGENKEFQKVCDEKLKELQTNTQIEEFAKNISDNLLARLKEEDIELEIEFE